MPNHKAEPLYRSNGFDFLAKIVDGLCADHRVGCTSNCAGMSVPNCPVYKSLMKEEPIRYY